MFRSPYPTVMTSKAPSGNGRRKASAPTRRGRVGAVGADRVGADPPQDPDGETERTFDLLYEAYFEPPKR